MCTSAKARFLDRRVDARRGLLTALSVDIIDRLAARDLRQHDLDEQHVALAGDEHRGPVDPRPAVRFLGRRSVGMVMLGGIGVEFIKPTPDASSPRA